MDKSRKSSYTVSLVVPVYNEEESVEFFVKTVKEKLVSELSHLKIVFVDDGSSDKTVEIINALIAEDESISLIKLSRNFGKEAAMSAAIDLVDTDAMVPIDVDLQDPPELILEFIRLWRDEGIDNVYGVRTDRSTDSEAKRLSAEWFYFVFNKLASSREHIPVNVGDFRLIDRKIIDILKNLKERNRFMKALYAWPGFSSKGVGYVRPKREMGFSKWNFWKLWNFALDGIFSFTSLPLRIWSYIGGVIAFLSLGYLLWNFAKTLVFGNETPGYTTLICVILFLGAVQLISIGVLGEYIGRLSLEVKGRPVYIVKDIKGKLKKHLKKGMSLSNNGITINATDDDATNDNLEEIYDAKQSSDELITPVKKSKRGRKPSNTSQNITNEVSESALTKEHRV